MKAFALACFVSLTSLYGFDVPYLSGTVVDELRLLNQEDISSIDSKVREIQKKTSVQIAVLIAKSLHDLPIEEFSMKVAEAWKLGKKGTDRGLLLVIAPTERRMRLEVGYGIEGELPDAVTKRILSDGIAPYFRQKQYGDGILLGLDWIEARLEKRAFAESPQRERVGGGLRLFIMLIFIALFIVAIMVRGFFSPFYGRGYDRWGSGGWGGGGGSWGGGGGWSGGGGGFGGGGSSSSW